MAEDLPPRGDSRPSPARPPRGGGSGADTGWAVTGTLISGMVVWGGVGWLLDQWLHIRVLAPVGIILGMAAAIYLVVVRYGAVDPPAGTRYRRTWTGRRSRPAGRTPPAHGTATRTQKGQR